MARERGGGPRARGSVELTGMRPGVSQSPPVPTPRWDVEPGGIGRVVAMIVMVLALGALAALSEWVA